jgi:hypothetical protein
MKKKTGEMEAIRLFYEAFAFQGDAYRADLQ